MRTFRHLLIAMGHDVTLLNRSEGGICFLVDGKDVGKDVRFRMHLGKRTFKIGDDFDTDLVWLTHKTGRKEYDHDNAGWVDLTDRRANGTGFTHKEVQDVERAMVDALGVSMHAIRNQGRRVQESDPSRDVNLHRGFDYNDAMKSHTRPDPLDAEEKTFYCFLCNEWKPERDFAQSSSGFYDQQLESHSDYLLARFVFRDDPNCDMCTAQATTNADTSPRGYMRQSKRSKPAGP